MHTGLLVYVPSEDERVVAEFGLQLRLDVTVKIHAEFVEVLHGFDGGMFDDDEELEQHLGGEALAHDLGAGEVRVPGSTYLTFSEIAGL